MYTEGVSLETQDDMIMERVGQEFSNPGHAGWLQIPPSTVLITRHMSMNTSIALQWPPVIMPWQLDNQLQCQSCWIWFVQLIRMNCTKHPGTCHAHTLKLLNSHGQSPRPKHETLPWALCRSRHVTVPVPWETNFDRYRLLANCSTDNALLSTLKKAKS